MSKTWKYGTYDRVDELWNGKKGVALQNRNVALKTPYVYYNLKCFIQIFTKSLK